MTLALAFALLLPTVLLGLSILSVFGYFRRGGRTLLEYVWVIGPILVACLSIAWLGASASSLDAGQLSEARAQANLKAGPFMFVALLAILGLRFIVEGIARMLRALKRGARACWARVVRQKG